MKRHALHLILATAVCAGAGLFYRRSGSMRPAPPKAPAEEAPAPEPPKPDVVAGPAAQPRPDPLPAPMAAARPAAREPALPMPAARPPAPNAEEQHQAALHRYWEQQARRFDQMVERLNQAEDPTQRNRLIQTMAGHVRVNTLQALEWAMSLTDPAERRAALEALNEKALSGIGARIEVDQTGFPRIRETTVLSAVAATGQVAPGDYIVGMRDAAGNAVYFEGLPARQVAQHLRGEPGTELQLQMERVAPDGSESYSYEVTIQRSLLVIQPPF